MSPPRHHHALPEGYTLHWYEIDSILGQGGFGITYLARDTNLDQPVAIKEFLPSDLATRTRDSAVHPLSAGHSDTYGWGLNRFLTEARTLAKFRHPNIVRVMSVFEANNTAYMVMEYERGESLENRLRRERLGGEQTLECLLLPLLDGLERVHQVGFIHRDIKPSNIYLREDGVPVLLDFGSARLALGVETRTLTSLVSPGYAPFEQYNATRDSDKQGPWTDIYALGATLYRAVTGKGPVDAAARADLLLEEKRDPYVACASMNLEGYSPRFLEAIDWALAFSPADRPQSVAAWRRLLLAPPVDRNAETLAVGPDATSLAEVDFALDAGGDDSASSPATQPDAFASVAASGARSGRASLIAAGIVVGLGVAVIAWLLIPGKRVPTPKTIIAAAPASAGRAASTPPTSAAPAPQGAAGTPLAAATSPAETPVEPAQTARSKEQASSNENPAAQSAGPRPSAAAESADSASPPEPVATSAPPAKKAPAREAAAAPASKPPEPVARAAPAAKAPASRPPARTTQSHKPPEPRTREEKIAALLVTADANLRADRLTKPRRRNALRDYLTVLAMDTDNAQARRGVERIVERYLVLADEAIAERRNQAADDALRQTRFVLDAMDFRHWPKGSYEPLWGRYLDATRALQAAR